MDFKGRKGVKKEMISKEHIVSGKVTLLKGTKGAYHADYLTSADRNKFYVYITQIF